MANHLILISRAFGKSVTYWSIEVKIAATVTPAMAKKPF
ncbi:MAG: hypothetical protein FD167_5425 [bacterium]|nr:MAG: hypothetical protein FD167_5425 [bacterium]